MKLNSLRNVQKFLIFTAMTYLLSQNAWASEQRQRTFTPKECCILSMWLFVGLTVQATTEVERYLKPAPEPEKAPRLRNMR